MGRHGFQIKIILYHVKHGDCVYWTVEVTHLFIFSVLLLELWQHFDILLSVDEQKLPVKEVMVASMKKIMTILV